jgi:signal transduction histidine kinase
MNTSYQIVLKGYVLAVEDSLVQAKKLKHFLDSNNLPNQFFSNAEDALTQARKDPPALVISDIMMPGMDGYGFCSIMKGDPVLKDIPVILLTSLRDPLDIIKGLQAGADNFITKPYEEQYLLSRIHYLLANRDLRRAGNAEMVIEIMFRGQKYQINSDKKQILDLLLSVYEAAVQRNDELLLTQAQLESVNESLITANNELEAFAYTVSHDLKSPLNAIAGFTQIIQDDYSDVLDPEAMDYLSKVKKSAFTMAQLIEDLLNFSRSARSEIVRENLDLSRLANFTVEEIIQRNSSYSALCRIQEGIRAYADKNLLYVVLDNLFNNAFKYSSKVDNPQITFGVDHENNVPVYFIQDNGAGFDQSKAGKLFMPFQRMHNTSDFQGTGVGLSTVKRIIERHGGRIWAKSAPGMGATFYFTLPDPGK